MFQFSSQHHSFDIKLAAAYGVECAILIHHFQHWIRLNRFANRNIKEGRCWSYQARKDIQAHFPYWTFEEVRYLCEKLETMGVLITENYNKSKIDKTLWYAFRDEKAFGVDEESSKSFYERENSLTRGKSPTPIPDTKTTDILEKKYKRKENATSADASALSQFFLSKVKECKPNFSKTVCDSWLKAFDKLLKIRTKAEIEKIIVFALTDQFWMPNCLTPDKLLKHLDTLEVLMKETKATSKEETLKKNRETAVLIAKKFPEHVKRNEINLGADYIEFIFGPMGYDHLDFNDPKFKEKVLNSLTKMNLTLEKID